MRKAADTTESDLVSLMVGRELVRRFDHQSYVPAEVVLKVEGLTTERVRDISFEVHRGEIVGFAGLVGAGRTELAKALFGEDWIARGKIYVRGKEARIKNPRQAIRAGLALPRRP